MLKDLASEIVSRVSQVYPNLSSETESDAPARARLDDVFSALQI